METHPRENHDNDEKSPFDKIIDEIGSAGPFQTKFNWLFNMVLVIFGAMPHLNVVLALSVPDHWCLVPGREHTNYTIEEWKRLHIPTELNLKGQMSFSQCNMYNHTLNGEEIGFLNDSTVECQYGWDFDKTWYEVTAPTQNQWFCENEINVANAFAICRSGEVVGTLILGHLADIWGRRPIFFVTILLMVTGRTLWTMSSAYLYLFFFAGFLGNFPSTAVMQGPLVIAMEISRPDKRGHIAMMQCFAWSFGQMLMPLAMWYLRSWIPFILLTSLPLSLFLFTGRCLIESPRWLANQGKISKCLEQLKKIADANGTQVPSSAEIILRKQASSKKSEAHGVCGLFSSFRLTKNTLCLINGFATFLLLYSIITLNVNNMGGNPFLNLFLQNLFEFPSYIIGQYISDKFGRRFVSIPSFFVSSLGCVSLIFLITEQDNINSWIIPSIAIFLKFCISVSFFAVNLQCLEIYPTAVRQTGVSVGLIFGGAVGISAPYIVLAGKTVNAAFPYTLMACLSVIAGICATFLPETNGHRLPETLEEAAVFGADQDFLGRSKKTKKRLGISLSIDDEAGIPLNPIKG